MIVTQRLLVRRWRPGDLEPFRALNADPAVMATLGDPLDRAASDALAARADALFDTHGYGLAAIERRDTGEFVGFAGLAPMPDDVPGAGGIEVGWRLARAAWGHGFATEAARVALDRAFGPLRLDEVHSITAAVNLRSQAVMRRLGMERRDEFDHPGVAPGSRLRRHVHFTLERPAA